MKKLIFILIIMSTFGVFASKPVVAVLEIDNKTSGKNRLSSDEAELIADLMRSELIKTAEFDVMPKEKMEEAIAKHVKKSHQLNRDSKYAIELGKTISARYIITSYIKTDGKAFRMFAEMIDTEIGKSPRSGNIKFIMGDDSKDEAIPDLIRQLLGERDESLIPKKPKKSEDLSACDNARDENIAETWEAYLELYPQGVCVKEAKEKLDDIMCQKAARINTIETWEEYLENYNGKCKMQAVTNIKKLKNAASRQQNSAHENQQNQYGENSNSAASSAATELVGNREWSELSEKKMNFHEAKNYCRKLRDNGNSDWRLPTIDELRTLIQNCHGSETSGKCRVSEDNDCLSYECLSERYCECGPNNLGDHSKLGDTVIIWSSSRKSGSNDSIFVVDFLRGGINSIYIGTRSNVRCTR